MLILSIPEEKRPKFEVQLPDGTELNLLPCEKDTVNQILAAKISLKSIDDVYTMIAKLLSCNTDGKPYTVENVNDWHVETAFKFFNEYIKFLVKVMNNPN